jgi:hypothetical protein
MRRVVILSLLSWRLFLLHDEDEMWTVWMRQARGRLVPQSFTLVLDFHVAGRCGKWDPGWTFFCYFLLRWDTERAGELREGGGGMRGGTPSHRGGVAFCVYQMLDAGC